MTLDTVMLSVTNNPQILNVIMLNVVILCVNMLNVLTLSVVAPTRVALRGLHSKGRLKLCLQVLV
jgi:hypothetical protein